MAGPARAASCVAMAAATGWPIACASAGAEVTFVQAYRRTLPSLTTPQTDLLRRARWHAPSRHCWLFSSSQAAGTPAPAWRRSPIGRQVVPSPPIRASRRRCARRASASVRSVRPTLGSAWCPSDALDTIDARTSTSDLDRCTVNQPRRRNVAAARGDRSHAARSSAARRRGCTVVAAAADGGAGCQPRCGWHGRPASACNRSSRSWCGASKTARRCRPRRGVLARQAQDASRDARAKVALLESRVAENTLQRTQLEDLLQSLTRSRDENMLSDIEAALRVARAAGRDHRQHRAAAGHAQAGRRAPGAQRAAAPGARATRRACTTSIACARWR